MAVGAMNWKTGGCHCRRVALEVVASDDIDVEDCNGSICAMTGYLHLMVPKERLRLTAGKDMLTTCEFNPGTAKHLFRRVCGITSFYLPRSHPDGYSLNARWLSPGAVPSLRVKPLDGRDWERPMQERRLVGAN